MFNVGNIKMKIKLIISLLCLLCSITSNAHKNRIINQEGDKLVGLPEEFTPAEFSWEKKVLRISDNQIDLDSFENVIPMEQKYDIDIPASWYHDTSITPPYICIRLNSEEKGIRYTIVLNLETLELIEVTNTSRISPDEYIITELKISDQNLKQIKSRTQKIKKIPTSS